MKTNLLKHVIFGLTALTAAGLSSCSESFLDVESKTDSNTETFYKTETDAYRALIGCYDGWRQTSSNPGVSFYVASEVLGAECFGGTGTSDTGNYQVLDRFDTNECPSDENILETDWKRYYEAIYRCNELITRENQIQWTDSLKHATYMGEVRTLRALCYFDAVRLWGNIPLVTTPTKDNLPQADPADVFDLIFRDLKYAADNMPADAYPKSQAASNDGHVTKYAAEALLARVYLFYNGYYGAEPASETGVTKASVLAGLEDVIASGEYSLVPEFKNLWRPASADITGTDFATFQGTYAGDGNSETLLSMKFTSTQDYNGNNDGNRWLVMMGLRSVSFAPYHYGWGACTVNPNVLNYYKTGDTRRSASVIDIDGEGISALDGFAENMSDTRDYTGYIVKKYQPLALADGTSVGELLDHTCSFQENGFQDYVIMRYADVLLMAAELGSSKAQTYFNEVRNRAFGGSAPEMSVTKANIMAERKAEFAFEGINYWDLLRQGIDEAAKQIAVSNLSVLEGGKQDVINISAANFKAKKGLVQIPNNQIVLSNNTLKQNAGW